MKTSLFTMIVSKIKLILFGLIVSSISFIIIKLIVQKLTSLHNIKKPARKLIKKLCSLGIAKEIYRNNNLSVLNVDDLFYMVFPYFSIEFGEPFGIVSTPKYISTLIDNSGRSSVKFMEFLIDKNNPDDMFWQAQLISLKESDFENLIKYCKKNSEKRPTKHISAELEKDLADNMLYRKLGILCVCWPLVCLYVFNFSRLLASLVSIVGAAVGIKSIVRSWKEYIKIDWKAVVGVLFSVIIIFSMIEHPPVEEIKKVIGEDDTRSYISWDELRPKNAQAYDTRSIDSYTTDIPYEKGTITDNVFRSEFIYLYGRLEDGYTWMSMDSLNSIIPSVDWECGVMGLESETNISGLFTVYVGNNAGYEECIAALEKVNPDFEPSEEFLGGTGRHTNKGLNDPQFSDRRVYRSAFFENAEGIKRGFSINKVNDRLVCVFSQYDENDGEHLVEFCEY